MISMNIPFPFKGQGYGWGKVFHRTVLLKTMNQTTLNTFESFLKTQQFAETEPDSSCLCFKAFSHL